jgi:hypothetical protein
MENKDDFDLNKLDQGCIIISGVRRWTAIKIHDQEETKKSKAKNEF